MNLIGMILATVAAVLFSVFGAVLLFLGLSSPILAILVGSEHGFLLGLVTLFPGSAIVVVVGVISIAISTGLFDTAERLRRVIRAGYHWDTPWSQK